MSNSIASGAHSKEAEAEALTVRSRGMQTYVVPTRANLGPNFLTWYAS